MRKFKVRNRQKRKYTRHNMPESSYQFSSLYAGLLPTVILAITFAAMLVMNMNLGEPESIAIEQPQFSQPSFSLPTFSLNDILRPIQNLPNLFVQPAAFLIGLIDLIATTMQSVLTAFVVGLERLLIMLDPRALFTAIGQSSADVASNAGAAGTSTVNVVSGATGAFANGLINAIVQLGIGIQTVLNAIVSFVLYILSILGTAFWFLVNGIAQIVLFVFHGFVSIITTIANAIGVLVNRLVNIILIPFQVIGAFWLVVKPYVDTLLYYCSLALNDMGQGFTNLANLGSLLQE